MSRKRYVITASCFDKKGRHLSTGVNDYKKSHPLMKHFAVLAGESHEKHFQPAELSACLQARGREIDSILVQRFDSQGRMKMAMPCPTCRKMLEAFGVKIVRYTTENGVKEYANTTTVR